MSTYVIIVEQKHSQETKRHSNKDPFDIQVPKVDQPAPRLRWIKGFGDGHAFDVRCIESSREVREADPEEGSKL